MSPMMLPCCSGTTLAMPRGFLSQQGTERSLFVFFLQLWQYDTSGGAFVFFWGSCASASGADIPFLLAVFLSGFIGITGFLVGTISRRHYEWQCGTDPPAWMLRTGWLSCGVGRICV